jgi:hypothetical protein
VPHAFVTHALRYRMAAKHSFLLSGVGLDPVAVVSPWNRYLPYSPDRS